MDNATCPLCGQAQTEPHDITICGGCHHALRARDIAAVRSTGEFTVAQVMQAAEEHVAEQVAPSAATGELTCSWCGKLAVHVKKLLSQGSAHICNECVALCSDILVAELGDGWRG